MSMHARSHRAADEKDDLSIDGDVLKLDKIDSEGQEPHIDELNPKPSDDPKGNKVCNRVESKTTSN